MATCRACPARIIFAQALPTAKNPYPSNNPLNASPQPDGNLRLNKSTRQYEVLVGDVLLAARSAGEELYLSHFANCPARKQFKTKGVGR
jgi:hypothetical protein